MDRVRKKLDLADSNVVKFRIKFEKLQQCGLTDITLRQYQMEGVNWLIERFHRGHGCILGDEMGLGKTCQTISLLVYLYGEKHITSPVLIISPLSVIPNWEQEVARFAPKLKLLSYLGSKDHRETLRSTMPAPSKAKHIGFDVILTTYEILLKDESYLHTFPWSVLVVDEAHRLKNHESLLHKVLCEFEISHRVLLTGTPVQNNLTELYSLLTFVAPHIFKPRYHEEFSCTYQQDVDRNKDVDKLHSLLQPFLLRRIKSEVLKDLPKKSEVILQHGLTALQKKYYKAILTKDLDAFDNTGPKKTSLMNVLMQLRKCVNHPYLFDGVEPEPFVLGEHLIEASGKLILIDQLLSFLKLQGHKVLLFSQMTRMLDVIQDYLGYRGYNYERLDGSVRGEERFLAIKNFNDDDEVFVFLLSTKAGGQGLNLTSADTVIFVDSDFNPQNDLQAAARAHRIGQTRPVKIVRLIGHSTVEEIILQRAEAKLRLTTTVIEGGQFSLTGGQGSLIADTTTQLADILKFGIDELFETDESSVKDVDFHKILGPSVDGAWQEEEEEEEQLKKTDEEADDESVSDTVPQNMYMFEGTDYSKEPTADDRRLFDELITAHRELIDSPSVSESRSLRTKTSDMTTLMGLLPELGQRKPRKQLSPEELEEKRIKRKEAAERRAKLAEEQEVQRSQEQRKKREELWERNGYTSSNIDLGSDGESDDDDDNDDADEDEVDRRAIQYISGDVTHPVNTDDMDAIIIHCADDSGVWGSGGVFSAISARSPQPEEQYTLARKMKDLALGDAHLIAIDDLQSRENAKDYLGLIIAQHRDKNHRLSGIKLSALSQGLERIAQAAKHRKASVHLPRIGYNTVGFNWYGTERLIRKLLSSRGVPTYIYYYPRRQKRKVGGDGDGPTMKVKKTKPDPSPASTPGRSSPAVMSSLFRGVVAYLHSDLSDHQIKRLHRYIIAYDGDIESTIQDSTTHVITNTTHLAELEELSTVIGQRDHVTIVNNQWVEDSLKKGRLLSTSDYRVTRPLL